MKTVNGNILVTATQKEMIMNHSYLQSSDCGFIFSFSEPDKAEIDPFEGAPYDGEKHYNMSVELDAMGWICVGEIFQKTKTTV